MGLTKEKMHRPVIGVTACRNGAAPCKSALNRQAQVVKVRMKEAGGTPRQFPAIPVTGGIAMG